MMDTYEKKYNEALERAKSLVKSKEIDIADMEYIFPELRESEEEMTRKELLNFVRSFWADHKEKLPQISRWVAYLEKQKEQKPRIEICSHSIKSKSYRENGIPTESISDELIDIIKGEFEGFRNLLKKKGIDYEPQCSYWEAFARLFDSSAREYVKEQKPVEWSEEDEKMRNLLISFFDELTTAEAGYHSLQKPMIIHWLKSLRPSWKPSEEQMEVLKEVVAYFGDSWISQKQKILESLYNDLLKQK